MLVQLHIENYALIDHVVVEFGPGLNVLTGETGTGKSMIIGALGLVLGQRASTDVVGSRQKSTLVEALFDITERPDVQGTLRDLDPSVCETMYRREIVAGACAAGASTTSRDWS